MKYHPILFKGDMVRAILSGAKTQTRRVIKPSWSRCLDLDDAEDRGRAAEGCPYGAPGGRLWVRETWAAEKRWDEDPPRNTSGSRWYRADGSCIRHLHEERGRWRPSIHMPRWASRITLEVTDVRVERVQEISEEDAKAEGPTTTTLKGEPFSIEGPGLEDAREAEFAWTSASYAFGVLWNRINGKRGFGWESNPWVFVVSFRRLP